MTATIKCFAALREQTGISEREVELEPGDSAASLWMIIQPIGMRHAASQGFKKGFIHFSIRGQKYHLMAGSWEVALYEV